MKSNTILYLTAFVFLGSMGWLGLTSGCASSGDPRDGYAQVNGVFADAQMFLIDQRIAGEYTDAEWEDIYRSLVLGDALLDEYDRRTAAGEPTGTVAGQLRDILEAIQPFLIDGGFYDDR